jgi:hypothetical protein
MMCSIPTGGLEADGSPLISQHLTGYHAGNISLKNEAAFLRSAHIDTGDPALVRLIFK